MEWRAQCICCGPTSRYVVDVTGEYSEFLQAAVELHARECSIVHRVPPPQLCSKGGGTTASGTMGRSMQHPLLADSTYQYSKVVGVVWWCYNYANVVVWPNEPGIGSQTGRSYVM